MRNLLRLKSILLKAMTFLSKLMSFLESARVPDGTMSGGTDVVRRQIEENAGTQIDPDMAKIMLGLIDKDTEYVMHEM